MDFSPILTVSLLKKNAAKANKGKQLVNRQLKQTANEPVICELIIIQ